MGDGMILIYAWGVICAFFYALSVIYKKKD